MHTLTYDVIYHFATQLSETLIVSSGSLLEMFFAGHSYVKSK